MQPLFKQLNSLIISVVLAILVWGVAISAQNPPRTDEYPVGIPVVIIPPATGFVTTDKLPSTVRLQLFAPQSSWDALSPSKFKASIDLSTLSAGFNDVPIEVVVSDPQIEILEKDPPTVSINLQEEQTITLPLKVQVMDTPPPGYVDRQPIVTPQTVNVTGPASLISLVSEASVELFIRDSKETINRTAKVIIRDREDQRLTDLTINPVRVEVDLPIEQRFGYKDVSVRADITGYAAPGYRVGKVSVTPPTITLVGHPQGLGSISGIIDTVPIDLSEATGTISRTVPLQLPDGVTIVLPEQQDGGPSGVQIVVEIAAIEDSITLRRPITQQGIDPAFSWEPSPRRADVFLSGPAPRIQTLQASDVNVIVDLFGLGPGTHKVQPTVFLPDDSLQVTILPETIEVVIGVNPTPTPSPTLAPTPIYQNQNEDIR
ncbi:MAG: CdaR family protein [Chloroflexota bacterium]